MSRTRTPSGPTVSLFPFLAVLLCTMGALLVVLVIFSRSAKQAGMAAAEEARERAEQAVAAELGELEVDRDELTWQLEQLRAIRDRTADDLAKARMQLAGTEEDARRLADELEGLGRVAEALEADPADPAVEKIKELEQRLAEAKRTLDEIRDGQAEKPPAYAVVPYEGNNGTHRRPLYIECCIDGVFLQPEGIRLGPADFEGPPGPGNPLASALRAAREHIAKTPGESGAPEVQPYPLLLVRPSGVMAYYAARESIQSWGSEFGYQFIDEEWTLAYPPRDPALAEVEMRAVEEARRRLEWLAQVRPVKRTKPATQYRAATTKGGVVANGGPSVLGDQSRFDWTEQQAGPGRGVVAGDVAGMGGRGMGTGDAGGGDAILGSGGGANGSSAFGGGGGGAGGSGSGAPGEAAASAALVGSRYAGPSKFYSGSGAAGGASGGDLSSAADGGSLAAAGGPGGMAGGDPSATGAAGGPGSAGGTEGSGSGAAVSAAGGGPSAAGGSGGGTSAAGGAGGMAASAGGSGAGGGGASGPAMPGLHQPGGGMSAGGASGASASLAGRRGSNWASLATQENPVPLTRPIRVECAADEFRVLGDGGRVQARVPIGTHTVDSIDPLVREVHATVGRWGLAGDRMYWKPELVLSATGDGVARRDDLEKLLADSGIETRRREDRDKVRNLPPVQRTSGLFPR